MTTLEDFLSDVKVGFACGKQDPFGIFQFRMHNVSKASNLILENRRRIPRDAHRRLDEFALQTGDVLFNATNSPDGVGKSVLVPELDEAAVYSNHFLRLRPNQSRLGSAYLWRWLQFQFGRGLFRSMCRQWVNQATVSKESLVALGISVPTLEEQRRVVASLDCADVVRTRRRQVLAHLNALDRSIFHKMFAAEPANVAVEELATSIRTGPFGSQLLHSEFVEDGVAVLGLDNIVQNDFRWLARRYVTLEKFAGLARYTVFPGDVLISIMGTIGRCAVVPDDIPTAINTKHICAVTMDRDRVDPAFLRAAFLWHPEVRAHLQRQAKGSIMDGLNMGIIKSMPVPVPSIERQHEFAALVQRTSLQRAIVEQALAVDEDLFVSLQSRAFLGEL